MYWPCAWPISATHERGLESRGYRFEFSNGLSATGVLLESLTRPQNGGTTLLIIVGVAMDTIQQVDSQLIMRHYDGFMKKTRIRGRRA